MIKAQAERARKYKILEDQHAQKIASINKAKEVSAYALQKSVGKVDPSNYYSNQLATICGNFNKVSYAFECDLLGSDCKSVYDKILDASRKGTYDNTYILYTCDAAHSAYQCAAAVLRAYAAALEGDVVALEKEIVHVETYTKEVKA
ncbi:MAG: hypothetical protein K2X94_04675 [Amoebophilaceae bacterium]|nr:hypothetical protein [Amoebophilaceae bacterium]